MPRCLQDEQSQFVKKIKDYLLFSGVDPICGYTTEVCDAWSVQRQTHGYLHSRVNHCPVTPVNGTSLYCLVTEAHVCEQLVQDH